MRHIFLLACIAGLLLSGCSRQPQPRTESSLVRDFSLGAVIERMNVPELKPMSSGSGGSSGTGQSSSSGSTQPGQTMRIRRDFQLVYQVEEQTLGGFNGDYFISQLRNEVEKVVAESGLHITGSGSSNDSFHFDYSEDGREGWLEVFGARAEGGKYKLWGVIRENVFTPKDN